jgi:hypothetical protein
MFKSFLEFIGVRTNTHQPVLIRAINQCNEVRYIQVSENPYSERRELLDVLLTKCKRLMSFVVEKESDSDTFYDIMELSNKVRLALYRNDDITHLYDEFNVYASKYNKNSRSSMNLRNLEI